MSSIIRGAIGRKITELVDTINGINGRCTRIWNLNFWWNHPDPSTELKARQFTGGRILTILNGNSRKVAGENKVVIDGREQYIAIKWEKGGNNNFFYLGFVFTPSDMNPRIEYKRYAEYVMSDDFWNDIQADAFARDIITAMGNPASPPSSLGVPGNLAKPVPVRRPDNEFVVDSIQVGVEMWGTEMVGTTGATCFSKFIIDTARRNVVTRSASCKAVVT